MLRALAIHDLAVIHHAAIDFSTGLTAITGETGAGKSLIGRALALALGGRGRTEWIRDGAAKVVVEATFAPEPAAIPLLEELGVPAEEEEWVLRRAVSRDGRNRIFANGVRLTVEQLGRLGSLLFQAHGQFEHQDLLIPAAQRDLLDRAAGATDLARACGDAYAHADRLRRHLATLRTEAQERESRLAYLAFQRQEIEAVDPQAGEDDALDERHRLLAHATEVRAALGALLARLRDDEPSLAGGVASVERGLEGLAPHLPETEGLLALAAEARINLEELSRALDDRERTVRDDPAELARVEERLTALRALHRKYGGSQAAVLDHYQAVVAEMGELAAHAAEEGDLAPQLAEAEARLAEAAAALSAARRQGARHLEEAITPLLADLEMAGARFVVDLTPHDSPTAHGGETVTFLLAANPGQAPRPLARVASGGELSRVGLALRRIQAGGAPPTLLFDEVDAGVGGRAAERIGLLLAELAHHRQVLCITHLPQVASVADHHLQVKKGVDGATARATVAPITGETRVTELARMLAGHEGDAAARRHAESLLQQDSPAAKRGRGADREPA